jgi:hypothetical protein
LDHKFSTCWLFMFPWDQPFQRERLMPKDACALARKKYHIQYSHACFHAYFSSNSKQLFVIFMFVIIGMEARQHDQRVHVQLETRGVARRVRSATMLAQRNADPTAQNEQSAFRKMVDDMAATSRGQEQRRLRLRQSIQMPTAGCIMKKHRSFVFCRRSPFPLKKVISSRDIAATIQPFPMTKQRSQQHLAPPRSKEKIKIRTKKPVSSQRVTLSPRLNRDLKNDTMVEKKQPPSIVHVGDSKNESSAKNHEQEPSVFGACTAGFAMGNYLFVYANRKFDCSNERKLQPSIVDIGSSTKNNLDQQPFVLGACTDDFGTGNHPSGYANRNFSYSNAPATTASSYSSSHLFGEQSLSDKLLDDLKAVGEAFKRMQLMQQPSSFIHTGCMGDVTRFQDFLEQDDSILDNKDATDDSVIHKEIVAESDGKSIANSTLTESMDGSTFNHETISTYSDGMLDHDGDDSTFSDCSSSYTFSDGESSTEDKKDKKKHGVKNPPKMRRIIRAPTATRAETTNAEGDIALAVSSNSAAPVWKAVRHVGATRARSRRHRNVFLDAAR